MEYSFVTVVETRAFRRKAARLLSEVQILELIVYLSANPDSGVLIKGAAGIRKLRWATSGRGKSGGVRVIYYFHNQDMPLYLLGVFGKNEKANLTGAEKNELRNLVNELVKLGCRRNE
jgi:hypothetical protein